MNTFRHYTNLSALIHMLRSKKITLVSPFHWDDEIDVHFMKEYKRRKKLRAIRAICFAQSRETFHHWKVFAGTRDGVCIHFDQTSLLAHFQNHKGISYGDVTYSFLNDLKELESISVERLPFTKRKAFEDEREYRVVCFDKGSRAPAASYSIGIQCIDKISLGPWFRKEWIGSVRETIQAIDGCEHLEIRKSTVLGSKLWKEIARRAV
jgi:hypothetical protein